MTVACDVMRGPYDGVGAALGKLSAFMAERRLAPAGAPTSSTVVSRPRPRIGQVRHRGVPPGRRAGPGLARGVRRARRQGDAATRVLACTAWGRARRPSPVMAQRASDEAKARKLVPAGHMRQISFSDPATTAPDQQVSELQLRSSGRSRKRPDAATAPLTAPDAARMVWPMRLVKHYRDLAARTRRAARRLDRQTSNACTSATRATLAAARPRPTGSGRARGAHVRAAPGRAVRSRAPALRLADPEQKGVAPRRLRGRPRARSAFDEAFAALAPEAFAATCSSARCARLRRGGAIGSGSAPGAEATSRRCAAPGRARVRRWSRRPPLVTDRERASRRRGSARRCSPRRGVRAPPPREALRDRRGGSYTCRGVGSGLGFPTANLDGVRCSCRRRDLRRAMRGALGRPPAAVYLGDRRPWATDALGGALLDGGGGSVRRRIALAFVDRRRGEQRFDGQRPLRAQMG